MTVTRTSLAQRVVDHGAEDDVRLGVRGLVDQARRPSLISNRPRSEPPWMESSTPWAPSMLASRSGDEIAISAACTGAVVAPRVADAHEGAARPALHDGLDVREVEVDEIGGRDEVRDALDTGQQHLVGLVERLQRADVAVRHRQEAVVRDDDEGVDLVAQVLDARRSCWTERRRPSNVKGRVTTPTVSAPSERAMRATTGAPPVPVPPPSPAVTKTMSAPRSTSSISSAWPRRPSCRPRGRGPSRPRVSSRPTSSLTSALGMRSAWASVLMAMNSTPLRPTTIIRLTAFTPPPPMPTTLILLGKFLKNPPSTPSIGQP